MLAKISDFTCFKIKVFIPSMVAEMLQKSKCLLYVLYSCYMKFCFCFIFHIYVICFIICSLHIYMYIMFFNFVIHSYFLLFDFDIMQNSYIKNICILMIRLLYENFYYMVFTRHPTGKIWSPNCIQDIVLPYQINLIRLT